MDDSSTKQDKISMKITDVYAVGKAVEIAINRMCYTADEINEFYNSWNSVMRFCEDVKRKTDIEKLYKEKQTPKIVEEEDELSKKPL